MSVFTDPAVTPAARDTAEDEECVALYVRHLLGWLSEQPGGRVLMLTPDQPLPTDGVGMRVTREKYPDRITYSRVARRLKALSGIDALSTGETAVGVIHGSVHRTPCDFKVTVQPNDSGVTVACQGSVE